MKFKVGDKVKHEEYGFGKIVYIDEETRAMPYAVQFKIFNESLHSLGIFGAPKVKNGHGRWCEEGDLELDKQQSHNTILKSCWRSSMKTAEEMFKELGFEKIEHTKSYIRYGIEKYYNDHIDFDIKNKMFRISTITGSGYRNPVYVKYELHKAITKQMEELGWIQQEKD